MSNDHETRDSLTKPESTHPAGSSPGSPAHTATIEFAWTDGSVDCTLPFPAAKECGGLVHFVGTTRDETHPEFGPLVALDYEAHRTVAEHSIRTISTNAARRFDARAIRVRHAIGRVPLTEASVVIEVACPHRAEAFDAARFIIDQLKRQAAIWKQEVWTRGNTWSTGTPANQSAGEDEAERS